jgi:hypothetical protein
MCYPPRQRRRANERVLQRRQSYGALMSKAEKIVFRNRKVTIARQAGRFGGVLAEAAETGAPMLAAILISLFALSNAHGAFAIPAFAVAAFIMLAAIDLAPRTVEHRCFVFPPLCFAAGRLAFTLSDPFPQHQEISHSSSYESPSDSIERGAAHQSRHSRQQSPVDRRRGAQSRRC